MQLPPELDQKFQTLLGRYPIKRSALVPMALYAQDIFGFVSGEMIEEIARRLELNTLQVTETLSYYSMIRRAPAGKSSTTSGISAMIVSGSKTTISAAMPSRIRPRSWKPQSVAGTSESMLTARSSVNACFVRTQ